MSRGAASASPDPGAQNRARVTGTGRPAGRGRHGPVPRASPAAPPLALRLVPGRRTTALPDSPIGCPWDAFSLPISDWPALPSAIGHAVVVGAGSGWSEQGIGAGLGLGIVLQAPVALARPGARLLCMESMMPHPPPPPPPRWSSVCSGFRSLFPIPLQAPSMVPCLLCPSTSWGRLSSKKSCRGPRWLQKRCPRSYLDTFWRQVTPQQPQEKSGSLETDHLFAHSHTHTRHRTFLGSEFPPPGSFLSPLLPKLMILDHRSVLPLHC